MENILLEKLKNLEFYVLVNKDNKFYRAKGYNGYGDTWVDEIKKAKVWNKIGPARSAQTFFSDDKYLSKGFEIPKIVKFTPGTVEILNEEERVKKVKLKKAKEEIAELERRLKCKELDLQKYEIMKNNDKHIIKAQIEQYKKSLAELKENLNKK